MRIICDAHGSHLITSWTMFSSVSWFTYTLSTNWIAREVLPGTVTCLTTLFPIRSFWTSWKNNSWKFVLNNQNFNNKCTYRKSWILVKVKRNLKSKFNLNPETFRISFIYSFHINWIIVYTYVHTLFTWIPCHPRITSTGSCHMITWFIYGAGTYFIAIIAIWTTCTNCKVT